MTNVLVPTRYGEENLENLGFKEPRFGVLQGHVTAAGYNCRNTDRGRGG
jgi:hypothetical protein